MTRKSKREIEHLIEELDDEHNRRDVDEEPLIEQRRPDHVVKFVYRVARDLMRLRWEKAEGTVSASPPEATAQFLDLVRERYEVEEDRDEEVQSMLISATQREKYRRPFDVFQTAPIAVAAHMELETADGETLEALVDASREEEAERLLVSTTYRVLADSDTGGATVEVPA